MQRGRYLNLPALAGALVLAAGVVCTAPRASAATAVPAGWTDADIGNIHNKPGSASATGSNATDVWTINGTGDDIWNAADSFHFTYTNLSGDGGVTARILTQSGGDPSWAKTGTMLRETVDPGSLDAYMPYTSGNKFEGSWRVKAKTTPVDTVPGYATTGNTGRTLAGGPIWIRTQRHGKSFQHLVSNDGKNWVLVGAQDVNIDPAEAILAGICATSHDATKVVNATFDNVAVTSDVVQPVASYQTPAPGSLAAVPGSGAVLLTFLPAPGTVGVNVYRQTQGGKDSPVLLNSQPDPYGWFIDTEAVNGTNYLYTVKSVVDLSAIGIERAESLATGAQIVAEPQVPLGAGFTVQYAGVITPAGIGLSNGVLTVTASGSHMWDTSAEGTFLAMPVSGDYSMNAKVLAAPADQSGLAANSDTKVGPMIRVSPGVVAGDAYGWVFTTVGRSDNSGLLFEGRPPGAGAKAFSDFGAKQADVKYPIWLKLNKKGGVISAFQSADGSTYTQVGMNHDFGLLPSVTYAGIGLTSGSATKTMTAMLDAASIQVGPAQ
jgi:hypothetical protein